MAVLLSFPLFLFIVLHLIPILQARRVRGPWVGVPLPSLVTLDHLSPLALSCPICKMGNLQITFQSCQVKEIIHVVWSTCPHTRIVISTVTFTRVAGSHSASEEPLSTQVG